MTAVVVLAVFVALMVVAVRAAGKAEAERLARLEGVVTALGWTWEAQGATAFRLGLDGLDLFSRGGQDRFREGATGQVHGMTFTVFRHVYRVQRGKSSHTVSMPACAVQVPGLVLPQLSMRAEGIFDKMGSLLGGQDIDFDEDVPFSKATRLRGMPEAEVRRVVGPDVRAFMGRHTDWQVEARGSVVAVVAPHQVVDDDGHEAFRDEVLMLVFALMQGAPEAD